MEINIDKLVEHALSPDEYVFLYYLVKSKPRKVNIRISTSFMEERGWIKVMEEEIIARQKAIDLFKEEEGLDIRTYDENKMMLENLQEWVSKWRELFPKGVKTGGYPVRGTKGGCEKKMRAFIKSNKNVTMSEIFKATRLYIKEKANERYSYMKMADYFIDKDGGSMLGAYIERINEENSSDTFDKQTNNLMDDI